MLGGGWAGGVGVLLQGGGGGGGWEGGLAFVGHARFGVVGLLLGAGSKRASGFEGGAALGVGGGAKRAFELGAARDDDELPDAPTSAPTYEPPDAPTSDEPPDAEHI